MPILSPFRPSSTLIPPVPRRPRLTTVLAAPFLYAMLMPLLIFDVCLELYHRIVFPILRLPQISRSAYIRIDRHRLSYLPPTWKLACAYCGYANGLLHYAARIAAETEAYFCPSKHQPVPGFHPPHHHRGFADYGDARGFFARIHRNRTVGTPMNECDSDHEPS
ncbi:MAG: hypothetical protein D6690_00805 [Nitrospirae bacterium]|nr:MAG: hypothetical protein D6690_00805 [Nitrospirota bacterium]